MTQKMNHGKCGCKYGSHRAIDPPGSLPQAAWKIDNNPEIVANEILVDVETLHINSTSLSQILIECGRDERNVRKRIMDIIQIRGKLHNPVTGSGGMLIGHIEKIGSQLDGQIQAKKGDKIATLVSLSLTPLKIDNINNICMTTGHVDVHGKAILFESGVFATLPDTIPSPLLLSALDCAGAPAMTKRMVKKNDTVVILGAGGRTGLLCSAAARGKTGKDGCVVALVRTERSLEIVKRADYFNHIIQEDATWPIKCIQKYQDLRAPLSVDVVINCINEPGTEMTAVLLTRNGGKILFANLATSFAAAALGAEGVGKDVDMQIYHGYVDGHAKLIIDMLSKDRHLLDLFSTIIRRNNNWH